jgi:hypothetical protein
VPVTEEREEQLSSSGGHCFNREIDVPRHLYLCPSLPAHGPIGTAEDSIRKPRYGGGHSP